MMTRRTQTVTWTASARSSLPGLPRAPFVLLCLAVGLVACGEDSSSGGTAPGAGVGQGGAQDFGLFRDILERGEIPGPETLDDLGFFAEHKIELPAADCGEDVCMHGRLGIMGNLISGANCTMIAIGFNTPLDPDELPRPDLDLALAVDTSGSMQGDPIAYVREGLLLMLPELEAGDRVTLVTYDDDAEVVAAEADPESIALENAVRNLRAGGATNLYDGLRVAFDSLPEAAEGRERRVILLSDGVATAGLEDDARAVRLARGYAEQGIGLTTIGVGRDFDVELMRRLSESGAGNFYFLEDPSAVREVFVEEVKTFLVPLALDVELTVEAGAGYVVRQVYGTRLWTLAMGDATIEIPSLFVAGRTEVGEPGEGRRGGGGAILVELVPSRTGTTLAPGRVGLLTMTWTSASDGEPRTETVELTSSLRPGETPPLGEFTDEQVEKAFVMLNLFAGFEMASERAADGSLSDALRVLQALGPNVEDWLDRQDEPDPDIEADLALVDRFVDNLVAAGATQPPPRAAPDPWPVD